MPVNVGPCAWDLPDPREAPGARGISAFIVGADAPAGPQQVERPARAEQARQDPAGAVLGDETALQEHGGERRLRRGDAHVAHRRQHHAAAGGDTVDRGEIGRAHV